MSCSPTSSWAEGCLTIVVAEWHTYERTAIEKWLMRNSISCVTQERLGHMRLTLCCQERHSQPAAILIWTACRQLALPCLPKFSLFVVHHEQSSHKYYYSYIVAFCTASMAHWFYNGHGFGHHICLVQSATSIAALESKYVQDSVTCKLASRLATCRRN